MPAAAVDVPAALAARPAPSAALEAPAAASTAAARARRADAGQRLSLGASQRAGPPLLTSWGLLALAGLWALGTLALLGRLALANLVTFAACAARDRATPAPWLGTARRLARRTGVPDTHFVRSRNDHDADGRRLPAADRGPARRGRRLARRADDLGAAARARPHPPPRLPDAARRQHDLRALLDEPAGRGTPPARCGASANGPATTRCWWPERPDPTYAEHLLDVARAARHVTTPTWSGGVAMAHRSELEGRLMAILDDARNRQSVSYGAAGIAGLLCLALVAPLAALDPWALAAAEAQPSAVAIPPGAGPAPQARRRRGRRWRRVDAAALVAMAPTAPGRRRRGAVVAPRAVDAPSRAARRRRRARSAPVIRRERPRWPRRSRRCRQGPRPQVATNMAFAFNSTCDGRPGPADADPRRRRRRAPTPTPTPSAVGRAAARAPERPPRDDAGRSAGHRRARRRPQGQRRRGPPAGGPLARPDARPGGRRRAAPGAAGHRRRGAAERRLRARPAPRRARHPRADDRAEGRQRGSARSAPPSPWRSSATRGPSTRCSSPPATPTATSVGRRSSPSARSTRPRQGCGDRGAQGQGCRGASDGRAPARPTGLRLAGSPHASSAHESVRGAVRALRRPLFHPRCCFSSSSPPAVRMSPALLSTRRRRAGAHDRIRHDASPWRRHRGRPRPTSRATCRRRPAAAPLATMRRDTVASLIAQLDSPVPAARALVACALAERKADAAPAIASLVALLDDDAVVSPYICREEWWLQRRRWRRHVPAPVAVDRADHARPGSRAGLVAHRHAQLRPGAARPAQGRRPRPPQRRLDPRRAARRARGGAADRPAR